ncbi:MAG: hypothetical protein LBJ62_09035 [Bifidobacteriaceae bacterium]|jgi:predicted unusual protein kinase regulating ubiquinone biosynthesis (AarF/ABC1/UbiB family)|nr:hypothetical protein [Bifidobacteriaceae bacterium]
MGRDWLDDDHPAQRYRRTLWLAARFTAQLWWLSKTARLLPAGRQAKRRHALYLRQAREFRVFATRMGGLVIKIGQFLSVRVDMLPKEFIDELSLLQDAVPAVPASSIKRVVESELGRPLTEVFAWFDPEPVAAASLGQVHRARLRDGRDVAVKIQRPGIERLVETDLRSLRSVLSLLSRYTKLLRLTDWQGICQDFEDTHRDELDYLKEGHNAEIFQRNFLFNPHVEMPQIHWDYTTAKVLTMEFMDGVKIDDLAALDRLGVDRSGLARDLMEIYLHMLLNDGFFHADPHPGNILVRSDGVIQLIDFGMVGEIPDAARQQYSQLVVAFFRRDADGVIASLKELGFVRWEADTGPLKASLIPLIDFVINSLIGLFRGGSLMDGALNDGPNDGLSQGLAGGSGAAASAGAVHGSGAAGSAGVSGRSGTSGRTGPGGLPLEQLREFILAQPISLPGQVSFLGKALITVFSNCFRLDPSVDLVAITQEWVRPLGVEATRQAVRQALADGWDLLRNLPATASKLVSVIEKMDDAALTARLQTAQLRQLEASRRAQTKRIVRAVAGATSVLGGLMIYLARRR